jgi:arylsulfatase A-like enzyme
VDEALAFIAECGAEPTPRPWFLWVAFNAPHKPYHVPPAHLHSQTLPPLGSDDPAYMRALTESMDTEIGRLLAGMDPAVRADTLVIFVGDNGTAASATTAPFPASHAKGTIFEGGLNVPLIVAGRRGAPRGAECARLVHTADLFATVAELAGIDARAALPGVTLDAQSVLSLVDDPSSPPVHQHVYAESFQPIGLPPPPGAHVRAIRDGRFKLIRRPTGEEFYDLLTDPLEDHELLAIGLTEAQAAAYHELSEAVASYLPVGGGGGG